MATRNAKKYLNSLIVSLFILTSMGFKTFIPDKAVFAANTAYLSAPYARSKVQVQQGWVSHFATYNSQKKNCGYYNGNTWIKVDYKPKSTTDGTYCLHQGIDFILGTPQSASSTWKAFDVVASMNGTIVCGYSATIGNYITQTQTYKDGNTIKVRYVHLKSPGEHCGENVQRGTKIGVAGKTGSGAAGGGVHLHLDVWKNNVLIDPYSISKKWNHYPPYVSVDWNALKDYWMIENDKIKIILLP